MARSKRKISQREAERDYSTKQAYSHYYTHLKDLAISTFKWDGLPETINVVYMEEMLYRYGLVAIFEDEVLGLLALPCTMAGDLNVYNEPRKIRAFAESNGYSKYLDLSECVLVYNQLKKLNSFDFKESLSMFAKRLMDCSRTEDINIFAQRTPITVVAPESQTESYLNALKQYEKYSKIIMGYKGFNVDSFTVLNTASPFVADKVDEMKIKIFNEALSFLGISNVSVFKKERVTTDEVNRAMGGAIASRNIRQLPREKALEELKKKFGDRYNFKEAKVTFNENLFDEMENALDEKAYSVRNVRGDEVNV